MSPCFPIPSRMFLSLFELQFPYLFKVVALTSTWLLWELSEILYMKEQGQCLTLVYTVRARFFSFPGSSWTFKTLSFILLFFNCFTPLNSWQEPNHVLDPPHLLSNEMMALEWLLRDVVLRSTSVSQNVNFLQWGYSLGCLCALFLAL